MLFAKLDEFDLERRTWLVPAERMKRKVPHRIPLTPVHWKSYKHGTRSWKQLALVTMGVLDSMPTYFRAQAEMGYCQIWRCQTCCPISALET